MSRRSRTRRSKQKAALAATWVSLVLGAVLVLLSIAQNQKARAIVPDSAIKAAVVP